MHVLKPQALGLSTRPIEYRKRFGLSVAGYLHVPFAQGPQGSLWSEQSMWNFLGREMALPLIDEGIAKLTSEFLVHGRAYTLPERRDEVQVRVALGHCSKSLLVSGDRAWAGSRPSAPQPFESLPIGWERAYGGPKFARNPAGCGHEAVEGVRGVPNVELPNDRVQRAGADVAPAGYGAIDVMHPQRAAWRGTYDETWLREHAPGFAPDLDWRHFNMAPQDQWLAEPLAGNEPYELENLHPTQARIAGRLPGLKVRAFVNYRPRPGAKGGSDRLREVPMRLTTVWFFPHAERMVLVFHGLAETAEDDGSDVLRLLGGVERLGEAKKPEHYLDAMAKRLDAKLAMVHALNDADLLPAGVSLADPEVEAVQAAMRPDGLREDAQYRRASIDVAMARDLVREQGKDPDALGIRIAPREKPPTTAELPAYLEKLQQEMEKQKWAAVEDAVTHAENAIALMKQTGADPLKLVHRGPPLYSADAQLAEFEKEYAKAGLPFDKAAMAPNLKRQELVHHLDYLKNAHHQPPVPPLQGDAAASARAEVEWLLKRKIKRWPAIDLTGADLSRLDLTGIDFSGAWLESADLRESVLCGANFSAAVLAHADLRGADATKANFAGANLGHAQLARATLDKADLSDALLTLCDLAETQLRGATLSKTDLLDTTWGRANWRAVIGKDLLFYKLDMKGLHLPAATLQACSFVQCDLTGVDFRGAQMAGCTFVGCKADKALFIGAGLAGATFADGTTLTHANFSTADLSNANLGECDLSGARLMRARLDGANLGKAKLTGCQAAGASAAGALLRKAVLQRALLPGADLKNAILQGADLRAADLRSANLYGADLARVLRNDGTLMTGALMDRARTWPRLPVSAS